MESQPNEKYKVIYMLLLFKLNPIFAKESLGPMDDAIYDNETERGEQLEVNTTDLLLLESRFLSDGTE